MWSALTSLRSPLFIETAVVATVALLTWFVLVPAFVPVTTSRQRAYVLSLLSSLTTSIGSLPLVYEVVVQGVDVKGLLLSPYNGDWSNRVTAFFMTFCFLDLAVGKAVYPDKIEWLTGWIHHLTYMALLTWVLSMGYASIFVTMCVLEIPTFFLALGSVYRPWRMDYVFASTFFLTRILFHAYMITSAFLSFGTHPIAFALSAFFPVHCFWFYGFVKQQQRLRKQRIRAKAESTPAVDQISTVPASASSVAATLIEDDDRPIARSSTSSSSSSSRLFNYTSPNRVQVAFNDALASRQHLTEAFRRHLPANNDALFHLPQDMIQRLTDRLPESIQRDLHRSSEKWRTFWDQVSQPPPSSPTAHFVAAH
ncbi:hypothetical protein BC940DRAFT_299057 [Gongronella butleri]|nr:hypothetical protein BC940DRAFT_299057 [Gongronella butleri]